MNPRLQGIGMTSRRTRERLIQRLRDEGVHDRRVLDVMLHIPRHIFMDEALGSRAYEDTALPIGGGQTISQPYIVALMTQALLEDGPLDKVLEVGTGSGYQTAILAPLVGQVYSVERIRWLKDQAQQRLEELGIDNVDLYYCDGGQGLPERAPFDGILVTAAPETLPEALIEQLTPNGRMVIPVGPRGNQDLLRIRRTLDGWREEFLGKVVFVPLRGGLD